MISPAVGGLFILATLVVLIMALFRRSPVRRFYASRAMPRRAAWLTVGAWVVVFIVLVSMTPPPPETGNSHHAAADRQTAATSTPRPATSEPTTAAATTAKAHASPPRGVPDQAQRARVKRIIDGDTLELAAVAAGSALHSTAQVDVRLLEIDTPETVHPSEPEQCFGAEATAQLRRLAPVGSTVWEIGRAHV